MTSPRSAPDITAYLAQPNEAEVELMRLFPLHSALTILDIGACEGEDSIRYARRFPRARVFAFEPLPMNQELIRANLLRYAAANVQLVPVALSDTVGEATFHVSSGRPRDLFAGEEWNYGNKSSSLLAPLDAAPMHGWIEFKEKVVVPTDTLDRCCARLGLSRIDFIQLDVQGAERLVLAGAAASLPRTTAIWLEVSTRELYRGQALDREIRRWMRREGFVLAHETYRDATTGEGDHLYLNRRSWRTWPYLVARLARRAYGRARGLAGRSKRALLSRTQRSP